MLGIWVWLWVWLWGCWRAKIFWGVVRTSWGFLREGEEWSGQVFFLVRVHVDWDAFHDSVGGKEMIMGLFCPFGLCRHLFFGFCEVRLLSRRRIK